ncbi:MAG: YciI family protein [Xanthomonadales bacterium]|nr:YciI family protein [Gammaproteobacteria bacterium]MBT8054388.1 YciI family protein [Gammaproteobacteria bacterium]NND56448.1 YciI family protein [Xanthomonadales bacterium]NNK51143.1 YciI family protein [Xanthomonadales bacterium]
MWYVIYAQDCPDSLAARLAARPAHVDRLKSLLEQGRLLLAGPRPAIDAEDPGPAGFAGSLVVAQFDSLDDARQWADEDPYVASGVYESVEVTPFKRVMPL